MKSIEQLEYEIAVQAIYLSAWKAEIDASRAALARATSGAMPQDAIAAWREALATFRQAGRSEVEAIRLCARAHPTLYAATSQPKDEPEQLAAPPATHWHQLVEQKVAAGMSRIEAIKAVNREYPDLYRAQVAPR